MVQPSKCQITKYIISLPQNQVTSSELSVNLEMYRLGINYFVKLIKKNTFCKHQYLLLKTQIPYVSFIRKILNNHTKPDLIYLRKISITLIFLSKEESTYMQKHICPLRHSVPSQRSLHPQSVKRKQVRCGTNKSGYLILVLRTYQEITIYIYAPMSAR